MRKGLQPSKRRRRSVLRQKDNSSLERIDHAALPGDSEFLFESRFDMGNRSDGDLFV